MKPIIKIEGLSKQYRLGVVGTGTLSNDLKRWWHRARGKEDPFLKVGETNDRSTKGDSNYVWALKDINLEVMPGEVLGIIGKNGAGKSTLLKILSKVTGPTTGRIDFNGRIGSLLEVGTGFHPELTGRENIFLNGAILGMTKAEIRGKLDEIVDFSGVERYLDTPVKRYSSGMMVRLGFAVAAHLEPEILVVDEVLAVGDAEFQKKAIGKMQDVSSIEGRTVLFVSHNIGAVKSLCNKAMVLENGKTSLNSDAEQAVAYYLGGKKGDSYNTKKFNDLYVDGIFDLHMIGLKNKDKDFGDPLNENEEIELHTDLSFLINDVERYHITYHLHNEMGEALFSFSNVNDDTIFYEGKNKIVCTFPNKFLQSGNYFLSLYVVEDRKSAILIERDILSFSVVDGERDLGVYMGREPGSIRPAFKWSNLRSDV
jgi:lipopolysaccharide transport system ATP-binding protein